MRVNTGSRLQNNDLLMHSTGVKPTHPRTHSSLTGANCQGPKPLISATTSGKAQYFPSLVRTTWDMVPWACFYYEKQFASLPTILPGAIGNLKRHPSAILKPCAMPLSGLGGYGCLQLVRQFMGYLTGDGLHDEPTLVEVYRYVGITFFRPGTTAPSPVRTRPTASRLQSSM